MDENKNKKERKEVVDKQGVWWEHYITLLKQKHLQ